MRSGWGLSPLERSDSRRHPTPPCPQAGEGAHRQLGHVRLSPRLTPMKIPTLPFTVTDWSKVEPTTRKGETGQATWRTLDIGDLRVRMVEYTPGYLADHWCDRGHVL